MTQIDQSDIIEIKSSLLAIGESTRKTEENLKEINKKLDDNAENVIRQDEQIKKTQENLVKFEQSQKEKDEIVHNRITRNENKSEAFRKWVYLTLIGAAGTIIVLILTFFLK